MGNAKVLTLCLHDWEYLLEHFPESKASIYEKYKKTFFDDDDRFPDKDKKRVQITKHPGRLREATLKMGFDREKRLAVLKKLRISSRSQSSAVLPVPQAKSDTPTKQLSLQSLKEVLPPATLSNLQPASSLFDVDQMSKLFPMNSRRDINSEDLTALKEMTPPQPTEDEQLDKTEENLKTESKVFEEERAKISEFVRELILISLEKFLEPAVNHRNTSATTSSPRPDDQANASVYEESQIDKHIEDDEIKTTDLQSAASSEDKQEEHEKEGSKEEKPLNDDETSKK